MMNGIIEHGAKLQVDYNAMEEVNVCMSKANAQLLHKATKNKNQINLMKDKIKDANRRNTTLIKRKERTAQRKRMNARNLKKGHNLIK